jgi:hypothetical protein
VVLFLVGYQDEPPTVQTYRAIVDGCVLFFAFFFFSLEPEPELVGSIPSKSHSYEAMLCISPDRNRVSVLCCRPHGVALCMGRTTPSMKYVLLCFI